MRSDKTNSTRRPAPPDAETTMRRMSRRSFLWSGAALAAVCAGWEWLTSRRADDGVPWPLRRALGWDEGLNRDYFSGDRLSAPYPSDAAGEPRVNGDIGLESEIDPMAWRLRLEGAEGDSGPRLITLDEIRRLPRHDMVTELRCIEGWQQVVHWTGARLRDFIAAHPPATRSGGRPDIDGAPDDLPEYVGLSTPDGDYYVGLDMASALHPQTLLCYEMNGQPLSDEHGAPLRLAIPVKYGIKNIKRIGTIRYSVERPADYWAEQGYDWYAGL